MAAILGASMALTACGGGTGGDGLSGSITADGSSTVFPITQAVAEEFGLEHPGVRISVGTSGTGGGFEKFCNGETDLSNASRPIEAEEESLCHDHGVEYLELSVAIDGLSVMVNPQNGFVECLTTDELRAIWEPNSDIRSWSEVRAGFPDQPLSLYGPGTDSGTFDYFTEAIVGDEGASRSDYTASEDDNVLVQGIAGDPNALGYFGYAYVVQNRDKLKVIGIDGGDGCVVPSEQTIEDGTYAPLSRPLFVYVAADAARRPETRAFVDFYLATVSELVGQVGYVPVPDETSTQNQKEWSEFTAS